MIEFIHLLLSKCFHYNIKIKLTNSIYRCVDNNLLIKFIIT